MGIQRTPQTVACPEKENPTRRAGGANYSVSKTLRFGLMSWETPSHERTRETQIEYLIN